MAYFRRGLLPKFIWFSSSTITNCCYSTTSSSASNTTAMLLPSKPVPFAPPKWCEGRLTQVPTHRFELANLPTPLYQIVHGRPQVFVENDITLLIKRDDATGGVELGGNKLRKLEFLLADAILSHNSDCVVTIGGEQSNHCRATAAASRMLGLEPHLILRTRKVGAPPSSTDSTTSSVDLGTTGNLLVDRVLGSQIYMCTPGEYGRVGSDQLVARVCAYLAQQTNNGDKNDHNHGSSHPTGKRRRPYAIPVGGSNGIGSWGYIRAVDELVTQLQNQTVEHIVFASGSGGTAAGIVLGVALAYGKSQRQCSSFASLPSPQVHAVGVCDNPDYFYRQVAKIAIEMGLVLLPEEERDMGTVEEFVRQHLTVHNGKGLGYAVSTDEELAFISSFARDTGVVLDPVYSGKALYHFVEQEIQQKPSSYRGQTILFWHTGGTLGLYDKVDESFLSRLQESSPCHRLDVYDKGTGIDISQEVTN
jgi:D-cysteine desulfhydrase